MPLSFETVARSDTGRIRADNEDAVFADSSCGLLLLADGMGGHSAGEVASAMSIEHIRQQLAIAHPTDDRDAADHLRTSIASANQQILAAARSNPAWTGMGTTIVAGWLIGKQLAIAHVGDSRMYLWRGRQLQRLTRDHSEIESLIEAGHSRELAEKIGRRNRITRALGADGYASADMAVQTLQVSDLILLCSDGLSDMLGDGTIARLLDECTNASLIDCAQTLIDEANRAGGRDNISVVLARVGPAHRAEYTPCG
jgi:protein phosphatase